MPTPIKRPFVPKSQVFYEEPEEEFIHEPIPKERMHPVGTYHDTYDTCETVEHNEYIQNAHK